MGGNGDGHDEGHVVRYTHVNICKVVQIVRHKKTHSKMAREFFLYLIFIAVYIAVVVLQRDAWNAETVYTMMKEYLEGEFRDPKTNMFLSHKSLKSVEDYWNWLDLIVLGNVYVTKETNFEDLAPERMNTMMRYNRLTSGLSLLQRRGAKEVCSPDGTDKYSGFAKDCQARIYLEGLIGGSKEPFLGADGMTQYSFDSHEVGVKGSGNFDVGFFQDFALDADKAKAQMTELRKQRWINEGTQWTRYVFGDRIL